MKVRVTGKNDLSLLENDLKLLEKSNYSCLKMESQKIGDKSFNLQLLDTILSIV